MNLSSTKQRIAAGIIGLALAGGVAGGVAAAVTSGSNTPQRVQVVTPADATQDTVPATTVDTTPVTDVPATTVAPVVTTPPVTEAPVTEPPTTQAPVRDVEPIAPPTTLLPCNLGGEQEPEPCIG